MDKLTELTDENKQKLLAKSFFTLPDNPSDKGYSASQIKKKGYEGLLVLYDYIRQIISECNSNVDIHASELNEKMDIDKSIVILDSVNDDITRYEINQVFYVLEDDELYKKNENGVLEDLYADIEERYAPVEDIEALFD